MKEPWGKAEKLNTTAKTRHLPNEIKGEKDGLRHLWGR